MNLYEIRKRAGYEPNAPISQKTAVRTWLQSLRADYQFAVTLTIKPSIHVLTERGAHIRKITRRDCDSIARRFIQKLNRQVFGKAAERYNKSLRYMPVVEGERSSKNLHFHFAVGGLPISYLPNQLQVMVRNAINLVRELDEQHDVQVMDGGWIEYFTKELGRNDTDNVLWQLA